MDGSVDPREAVVRRVLDRYLVEIVEAYDLCPWAAAARTGGELGVAVVFGRAGGAELAAAAGELLARPETRVAMVVAPELVATQRELRDLRDAVAAAVGTAGVADFHPDAPLDLGTPARAVPYCRRSPDPLLQLVPFALLDAIRGNGKIAATDRAAQLAALGGYLTAPRAGVTERIASANHAALTAHASAIAAIYADIAADRAASYARAGIAVVRSSSR